MNDNLSDFDVLKDKLGANKPHDKGIPSHLLLTGHFKVTIMVVLISFSSLAIFGFAGYKLDQYFDTGYILTILLLLISFPTAQYMMYRWIIGTYLKSIKKKSSSDEKNSKS